MFEEDYILRIIKENIQILAKMIFNKDLDQDKFITEKEQLNLIHLELIGLINSGNLNKAENILFSNIDTRKIEYLELGLDFYNRLNKLSDQELEDGDFLRAEIHQGLKDFVIKYGINIWNK